MKAKRIALMAIMLVAVLCAKAQYEPGKWAILIKGGHGASHLTNMERIPLSDSNLDPQFISSSVFGMDVEYQVSKQLGLSVGLNRSWQGSGWEEFTDANNIKYKDPQIKLEYINVPLLANFYVYKGLALKTGLELGYLIDADACVRTESSLDGRDLTVKTTIDMEKDCKKFDLSVPVGISYEFKRHWVLDARYNIGLTKVNKEHVFGEKDNKNGMFIFTFGYKFDI